MNWMHKWFLGALIMAALLVGAIFFAKQGETAKNPSSLANDTGARQEQEIEDNVLTAVQGAVQGVVQGAMQGEGVEGEDRTIERLLDQVTSRLSENPEDEDGWILLARTYETLKRPEEASKAWASLLEIVPDHEDGLWFSGVHAAQRGDQNAARDYWRKLQQQYSPGTDDYDLIEQALATLP